ncbi:RbsD/FucU domain-containing protein [Streptomyces sp. NPDC002308]
MSRSPTATTPRARPSGHDRVVQLSVAPDLLDIPSALDVMVRAIPVESAQVMVPPQGEPERPAIADSRARLGTVPVESLDRFAFYDAARSPDVALAIVTADTRTYANLLLTISVRADTTPH